jgi:hypothetical protein
VLGGLYVAAHTDLEVPCGCCTWFAGYRMEWDYQWIDDIGVVNLEDNLSDLNLLLTVGVRY